MSDFIEAGFWGFMLGLLLGTVWVFWFGAWSERHDWQRDTIERGLAQYCPNNGEWAWKGECDD